MKIAASIFKTLFLCLCIIANTHLAYAQTASILPQGKTQFLDNNGKPLTSGTVDFYIPSTTTRKTTWQNSAETVANSNPVVLDAGGRAIIYGDGSYRQVVKDRLGNVIWDQVTSSTGSGSGGSTATGDGDLVGTIKPWAGMTAPNQYVFTYGQEISRTTYSALFTAITSSQSVFCTSGSPTLAGLSDTTNFWVGASVEVSCLAAGFSTIISKTSSSITLASNANVSTNVTAIIFPWGRGNGTTTFNVPDLRGFAIAGNNNMGGAASSTLTTTYFGSADPNSVGAAGGSQSTSITLVSDNLPPYTPGGTITNGAINIVNGTSGAAFATAMGTNNIGSGGTNGNQALTLTATQAASTFAGTAQGGTSTPIVKSLIQPTKTSNYIIKITPDTNSATASGVTSLGGMTGDIACGSGLLCTGNNVSVTSTPLVVGSTAITSGVSGRVLYDNGGALGEYAISGTGNVVMTTSPTLTAPNIAIIQNTTSVQFLNGAAALGIQTGTVCAEAAYANCSSVPTNGIYTKGDIAMAGSTSGLGTLKAPAVASTYIWTMPAASDTIIGRATTDTLTNKTFDTAGTGNSFSINGLAATANTGTGAVVRATSPALVTPALGTPSSGTLTNATGLPISTGISGLGSGVAGQLAIAISTAGGSTTTIATGTSALGTSAIASAACATVVTTAATNTATTDVVTAGFNGDPTAVTGYTPSTSGMLTIISYPTANNVNFKVCNNTASSITPGAITLNWRVVR